VYGRESLDTLFSHKTLQQPRVRFSQIHHQQSVHDIRTPSIEDFRQGRNFKIVELNGVTSEATHIYQPGNSIWNAYRTLMRQWRIAFEIGAANRNRGMQPSSARRLLAALLPARAPHRPRP
jgi:hypothetical protein